MQIEFEDFLTSGSESHYDVYYISDKNSRQRLFSNNRLINDSPRGYSQNQSVDNDIKSLTINMDSLDDDEQIKAVLLRIKSYIGEAGFTLRVASQYKKLVSDGF